MALKRWRCMNVNKDNALRISQEYDIPLFLAIMLDIRGVDFKKIEDFLYCDGELADPCTFADMDKAVFRIRRAVDNFERICVYGDYDADGVTATTLMYMHLQSLGADVIYYIPDRHIEGYGLNISAIDKLKKAGVHLIITVDNGVSAIAEVAYAKSLFIDTVITDHHRVPAQLPGAVAVVDLHRSDCPSVFKDYAGVGLVFKLICAMEHECIDVDTLLEDYGDLVAIGTIGDIVPLVGENRVLVRRGIRSIAATDKPGLRALLDCASVSADELSVRDVSFKVVPRINAAGRLDDAQKVVRLLISDDPDEAVLCAQEIDEKNASRKQIELEVFDQAELLLKSEPQRIYQQVLVVEGAAWHPGVIGIVAARLLEKYSKPTIVISIDGQIARGSCRSVEGFSIYDAISTAADYLIKFGGHPMAAGFDVKVCNLPRFKTDIARFAMDFGEVPTPELRIDCKLKPHAINMDLISAIDVLEPCGKDNSTPIFGLYGMKLEDVLPIGKGKHLKLTLSRDDRKLTVMKFFTEPQDFGYVRGDVVDLAVTVSKSLYNGHQSVVIYASDIKPSELDHDEYLNQMRLYEIVKRGVCTGGPVAFKPPCREEFSAVYRYLRHAGCINLSADILCLRLSKLDISFSRVLVIFDILNELFLITLTVDADRYCISVNDKPAKARLESSGILKLLQEEVD